MLNNNRKNSVCAFAEPLISYLYGEIGNAEKAEFEAHLKNCSACNNELADFGFTRSAVQEWRAEEFDVLPTPVFEIPANTVKTRLTSQNPRSWFDDFKQIFSLKPALALSALTLLIVFAGLALFSVIFTNDNQIAGKNTAQNTFDTAVSPTIEEIKRDQLEQIVSSEPAETESKMVVPSETKSKNSMAKVSVRKHSSQNITAMKVSVNTPGNPSANLGQMPNTKSAGDVNKKVSPAQKLKIPNLNESEDLEDTSVRLADLFDEIETR